MPAGPGRDRTLDGATPATAVATADALANGLLPQWRARVAPSLRIADKPGYRILGRQLSLRLE